MSAYHARKAPATSVFARIASARAAPARLEMFKMLVFLIASPYVGLVSWMGAVYLSQGYLSEALPLVALTLMSVSYLTKGGS